MKITFKPEDIINVKQNRGEMTIPEKRTRRKLLRMTTGCPGRSVKPQTSPEPVTRVVTE